MIKKKEYSHLGELLLDFDGDSKNSEYKELKCINVVTLSLSALLGSFICYLHAALGVDLIAYKNVGLEFSNITVISYYISVMAITPFVMLVTVPRFWYRAALMRYKCRHTKIDSFVFEAKYTGQSLLWMSLSSTAALILTLGLAYPYTIHRKILYTCQNLHIKSDAI